MSIDAESAYPDKPYMSREEAFERISRRIRLTLDGCWLWGKASDAEPYRPTSNRFIKLCRNGKSVRLSVARLSWWVHKGVYPDGTKQLRATCKNVCCINPAHLTQKRLDNQKKLTDAQVREARELYWSGHLRLTEQQMRMKPISAEHLAAKALGIPEKTVRKVIANKPISPHRWRRSYLSVEQVKKAVASYASTADSLRRDQAQKWTMPALAKRYGVTYSGMRQVLHGVYYDYLEMPQAARIRVQKAARQEYHYRLARAARGIASNPTATSQPMRQRLAGALDCVMS